MLNSEGSCTYVLSSEKPRYDNTGENIPSCLGCFPTTPMLQLSPELIGMTRTD